MDPQSPLDLRQPTFSGTQSLGSLPKVAGDDISAIGLYAMLLGRSLSNLELVFGPDTVGAVRGARNLAAVDAVAEGLFVGISISCRNNQEFLTFITGSPSTVYLTLPQ